MQQIDETVNQSKKLNLKIWAKIFKYAKKEWPLLLVILLCMLFTAFYDSSFLPLMNSTAINTLTGLNGSIIDIRLLEFNIVAYGINFPTINYYGYCIILLVAILIRAFSVFFTFFITNKIGVNIMTALRRDSYKVIQELSYSYFDKTPSGWLISRLQSDVNAIGETMSWGISRFFWSVFDLFFTLITMFTIDWRLSLIILSMTPLISVIFIYLNRVILDKHRKSRTAYSSFVKWLSECIAGVKTIKVLSIEEKVYDEQQQIVENVRDLRFKAHIPNALFNPLFNVLSAITTAIIIACGLYAFNGSIQISTLILFIGFVTSIYNPLIDFSDTFAEFMSTQANAEKLISLIETKPEIKDNEEVISKYGTLFNPKLENYEHMEGSIEFKNVSFSYIKDIEVIHNMNLKIDKGDVVAIVGETGSGKSTTVNLLCRFYEPTSGEILIDNINYKDRSLGWLRSNIGYIQQNPFIFSSSFKDNIKYGKQNATDEEIIEICKDLGLHEFIMSQKNGYDTIIKEGGSELSVGQKQLLSFARALIRNPSIMILDEATSSIDTETEQEIESTLFRFIKGRTSIIIAHRLSTIVDCNRILVMKNGVIVEDGNHVSLMKQKGYYYELYMNQFKELDISSQLDIYKSQIEDKGL